MFFVFCVQRLLRCGSAHAQYLSFIKIRQDKQSYIFADDEN